MKYIKENLIFFIFMIVMCAFGGYFITVNALSSLDAKTLEEAVKQVGSKEMLLGISVLQVTVYAVFFAAAGIVLSNKVGLWKKFEKNSRALGYTALVCIIGGLAISVFDRYVFGAIIEPVRRSYLSKPTVTYILSSFTYGGVFEEIMMRLFLMSLFAYVIAKVFCKKKEEIPTAVFVFANVICALLFAAAHLPATKQTFGYLDAWILFRCFLLNGGFGLAFGWLYRKYGIGYSMLAHFGAHLVS